MNWKHKLKSGALQLTIFISLLIALLLSGVILLAYTHHFFIEQSKALIGNVQLADTGIAALQEQNFLSNDTVGMSLIDSRENQSVKIHLSQWGIFEKGIAISMHRNKTFSKLSLLGSSLKSSERPAIYLSENLNPLIIAGHSKVTGNTILPEQGAHSGNILGNNYHGKQLIYGAIKKSSPELPRLKYDYKKRLQFYLNEYKPEEQGDFIPLFDKNNIINSFNSQTKGYHSEELIVLENKSIIGNVIIRSSKKIIIKNTALLKDIILSAPEIIIEDNFKGNFQAIANSSIRVGKNCTLNYPSALVIVEKDIIDSDKFSFSNTNYFENKIYIDNNSLIKGSICYFKTDSKERDFKTQIYISDNSKIFGEIYCEGNIELKACSVSGSIYTNYFISNESGITFVNHIYNSIINSESLHENFGGLLFDSQSKSIIKWLY